MQRLRASDYDSPQTAGKKYQGDSVIFPQAFSFFFSVPDMAPVGQDLMHAPQRIHSGELGLLQTSMSILQLPEHLPHLMHFD